MSLKYETNLLIASKALSRNCTNELGLLDTLPNYSSKFFIGPLVPSLEISSKSSDKKKLQAPLWTKITQSICFYVCRIHSLSGGGKLHICCSHKKHSRLDNLRTLILSNNNLTHINFYSSSDHDRMSQASEDSVEGWAKKKKTLPRLFIEVYSRGF